LHLVQERILREMRDARNQIDSYLEDALDLANKALDQELGEDEYVMAGESRLLGNATAEEMIKLRDLFDSFEQKKDLLHLLERCTRAEGVQIFIGEEAGYEVFGDYSVVTAPYFDGTRTLGVLGVIGPTRMAYERVIPIVDVTARMLSSALSG
jgi:heat-inducible transcriptional repressor